MAEMQQKPARKHLFSEISPQLFFTLQLLGFGQGTIRLNA
jgi:hypothetical protein